MNVFIRAAACAGLALIAVGAVHAQNEAGCKAVQFSDELLNRFPRAPEACLDVISRGGQDYAVFNVQLDRVSGNTLQVRFQYPDGSLGPSTRLTPPRDFRVLVDGEPTRVSDLAPNQRLKTYVQVSQSMVALEPADSADTLVVMPLIVEDAAPTRVAAAENTSLPRTAGPAPLVATVGVFFMCAALGARAIRGLRSLRRKRLAKLSST